MFEEIMKFFQQGGAGAAPAAGAAAMPDLSSNANLAANAGNVSFNTGSTAPQFGAFNSVDAAGSAPSTQMADLSGGIPTTPGDQAQAGVLPQGGDAGFDYKGMVGQLGKAAKEVQSQAAPKMTAVSTKPSGIPSGAQPIMMPTGIGGGASGAMQAIQMGNMIGGQPTREQLMKRMGY